MKFETDNYTGLVEGLYYSKNSFEREVAFKVKKAKKVLGDEPYDEIKKTIFNRIYFLDIYKAQLTSTHTSYLLNKDKDVLNSTLTFDYMMSEKELNDLKCIASEIGILLKKTLKEGHTFYDMVNAYQHFLSKYFTYCSDNGTNVHSALELIKNREGVCQAIAALTLLVIPYMGYRTIYCIGKGKTISGWEPHAWNIIETPLGFRHFDFTFGLSSEKTDNTLREEDKLSFFSCHYFDENLYDEDNISAILGIIDIAMSREIFLTLGSKNLKIGNVKIGLDEAILNKEGLNLYKLISLLGGGIEYIKGEDKLRVLLNSKVYSIKRGSDFLKGNKGYMDLSVLKFLPFEVLSDEKNVLLKKVG